MLNDNIEVFLRRVGPRPTRYLEYVRPGHEQKFQSQDMQCYVAATSEGRFQIHVRLHHGFRYFTATCLEIRLWLDAHDEPDVYLRRKVHVPANGLKYVDFVLKDFAVQVGDHWENGDLCFGEVQIDGDKEKRYRKADLMDRARKLGTIRVSVQRGRQDADRVGQDEPESLALDGKITSTDYLNGISHYVKTVNNRVIDALDSDKSTLFKRVAGHHGERFNFEFRYRHRTELQRLGMIDENGRRIVTISNNEDEDELPIAPSRRAFTHTNPSTLPSPHLASSPPPVSTALRPYLPSQHTFSSSPLSGHSTKRANIPAPPHPHKKRRLLPATSSSRNQSTSPLPAYPPAKSRNAESPIDLTRSISPASSEPAKTSPAPAFSSPRPSPSSSSLSSSKQLQSNQHRPPARPLTRFPTATTPSTRALPTTAGASAPTSTLPTARLPASSPTAAVSPPPRTDEVPFTTFMAGVQAAGSSADTNSGVGGRSDPPAASPGGDGDGDGVHDDGMSEAELQLKLRRMEMQQRAFELEKKQLEMQQRQMEYEIRLERMKRARRQGQDPGAQSGDGDGDGGASAWDGPEEV
ncbi:hypothetical protein DIS24_g4300 [Lasiodiplodia hormozganensis]|uniref:DUF7918 domain-containing protein n=1 Tax=Lasiodiplodia hormozganensis TaxID=869390 RepID=A0AA39YUR2_9PEZI|nr:hypothetical protein DIS24_g4300 [Lasiodiplodia hormozganensis]